MCLVLYLGSDLQLPITEPWNPNRTFSVSDAGADCPVAVRDILKRSFIYMLHSVQGCGCGFYVEATADREAAYAGMPSEVVELCRETDRLHRLSVEGLHDYLRQASANTQSPLRLLVTWAGMEGTAPKRTETVTPSKFRPSDSEFHLDQFRLFELAAQS